MSINVPPILPGKDVVLSSTKQMLVCPHCVRKINVVFIGKDGKAIKVDCPYCKKKIGLDFINKSIIHLKEKEAAEKETKDKEGKDGKERKHEEKAAKEKK